MKNFILKMLLILGLSFSFANADDFIKEGSSYTVTSQGSSKYSLYFTITQSLTNDLFVVTGKWTRTSGKTLAFVATLKKEGDIVYIGKAIDENGKQDNQYIQFIPRGDNTMFNGNTLTLKKVSTPEDMR